MKKNKSPNRTLKRKAQKKEKEALKNVTPEKMAGLADALKQWAKEKNIPEDQITLQHIQQFALESVRVKKQIK